MQGKQITIFGGSGFIGRSLVQKLAREGAIIRVPVRDPNHALFLKTLGHVGQVTLIKINIYDQEAIKSCCMGSDIIINLLGILFEKRSTTFEKIHIDVARVIAQSAAEERAKRLLHVSALNAASQAKSKYAKTKIQGEDAVFKAYPSATIFRPSLVFGPHDHFVNNFAEMSRFLPILPLIGAGKTRLQPIYVGDVAEAMLVAIKHSETKEKIYELGGPQVYSFKELLKLILQTIQRKRVLLPIPYFIAKILGFFCEFLPTPILTRDQVKMLENDVIINKESLTCENLGISPHSIESILPQYLSHYKLNA